MPVVVSPACHAGSGAAAHFPLVSGAMPPSCAGAQAPEIQVASDPSFICLFHCGENEGFFWMSPFLTSVSQYVATFLDSAPLMSTCQLVPLGVHQSAPACWVSPVNQPGSPASKLVMETFGAF